MTETFVIPVDQNFTMTENKKTFEEIILNQEIYN